jgi:hypothetical protein
MADFSKQYVDRYLKGWPHDFDIDKQFLEIPNGHTMPIICEGFGFWGLQKDKDGKKYCLYEDDNGYTIPIPYENITDKTYREIKKPTFK